MGEVDSHPRPTAHLRPPLDPRPNIPSALGRASTHRRRCRAWMGPAQLISCDATDLLGHGRHRAGAGPHMCVPQQESHYRSESGAPRAARPARPPRVSRTRPRPAEGRRRAAHACAAIGASPSLRDLHAPCSSRGATALPGPGRRNMAGTVRRPGTLGRLRMQLLPTRSWEILFHSRGSESVMSSQF